MEEIPVYHLKALSRKLEISVRTLREYVKKRHLIAYKIGRSFYVTENELRHFLREREAYSHRRRDAYPFRDDE
jgi:hypothetical protein